MAIWVNRTPTSTLETTPYEMWESRKPDLKNLQLFGCKAYAKALGPLKKLDERSKSYTFVGYAPSGYRLWDAEKRKIITAKDVKFEETIKTGKEKVTINSLRKRQRVGRKEKSKG